jgi:two-component system, response regulator
LLPVAGPEIETTLSSLALDPTHPLSPILIADDDTDDAVILEHRLKKAGVRNPVLRFCDGQDVVEFFRQLKNDAPKPCVLLLDLKMPLMDGFDVLQWLAQSPLKGMPVTVISSSPRGEDRVRAAAHGAMEYFEKFPTSDEMAGVIARASAHPFARG